MQNDNLFTSLNLRHLYLVLKSTSSLKTESLRPCTRRLHRLTFILASISVSSLIFLDDDPGETPNGFKNILKISSHAFHTRTTDTQWRHKSKKSESFGRYGKQNILRPYLTIWDWDWIFGHAVKAISSLGVRSPCFHTLWLKMMCARARTYESPKRRTFTLR